MSSEKMILRINPTLRDHSSPAESHWPIRCSAKIYDSWKQMVETSNSVGDDRKLVMIEINLDPGEKGAPSAERTIEMTADKSSPSIEAQEYPNSTWVAESFPSSHAVHDNALRFLAAEYRRLRQVPFMDGAVQAFRQRFQQLSPRELDVLILLMQGRSCKEVAARLEVGLATAAKHRARIFKKLSIRNSIELLHLLSAIFDDRADVSGTATERPMQTR